MESNSEAGPSKPRTQSIPAKNILSDPLYLIRYTKDNEWWEEEFGAPTRSANLLCMGDLNPSKPTHPIREPTTESESSSSTSATNTEVQTPEDGTSADVDMKFTDSDEEDDYMDQEEEDTETIVAGPLKRRDSTPDANSRVSESGQSTPRAFSREPTSRTTPTPTSYQIKHYNFPVPSSHNVLGMKTIRDQGTISPSSLRSNTATSHLNYLSTNFTPHSSLTQQTIAINPQLWKEMTMTFGP